MVLVKELADAFMILIRAGATLRVIYCFIKMGCNDDESSTYKKRVWNIVAFYVLAELVWQIKEVVLGYYS